MRAAYAEPIQTPYSLDDIAYALRTGLTSILGYRPPNKVVAVGMAKVRLESGNGHHVWNNDIGNVKCPPDVAGNFTCIVLNEVEKKQGDDKSRVYWYAPEGELVGGRDSALKFPPLEVPDGHPQTRMRSLANTTDAGYFYVDFIFSNKRYAEAQQGLLAGNPEAYVRGLKKGGYFTAPLESYLATVMKLYEPSLAFLENRSVSQPEQLPRDEWHNQLLLDQFVETEYDRIAYGPREIPSIEDIEK